MPICASPFVTVALLASTFPSSSPEPAVPAFAVEPVFAEREPWDTYQLPKLDYSYAEISGLQAEVGDLDDEATGWKVAASIDVTNRLRAYFQLADTELTEGGIDIDETDVAFGIGYHAPLKDGVDWTFDLGYVDEDSRRQVGQGAAFDFGLRWRPTSLVELGGGVIFHLYDDSEFAVSDAIGFRGEGHLWLQDRLSLFARFETFDSDALPNGIATDRTNLQIGARFTF